MHDVHGVLQRPVRRRGALLCAAHRDVQVGGRLLHAPDLPGRALLRSLGNRLCDGRISSPTIERWFDTSCFVQVSEITGTYGDSGRGIIRGPGSFNIDASIIKNTRIGRFATEIRLEAFNVLNHPQFGNPNTTVGNAAFGTISAMLSSPSCSLCGTVERQVQLGVKVRF